jgi:hypothetical protein
MLDCVVKSNPNVITLEWFKDKYLLSNNNKFQILPNNSLLIRNVQKTDKGQYYCTCNNTLRKVVSPPIKLEIIDAKKIEITTLYTSNAQSSFTLPCRALMFGESQSSEITVDQIDDASEIKWFKVTVVSALFKWHMISCDLVIISNLLSYFKKS